MRSLPFRPACLLAIALAALSAVPGEAAVRACPPGAQTPEARARASCNRRPHLPAPGKMRASGRRLDLAALDSDVPVTPHLSPEEAQAALDRELSLKVGKHMREEDYPDEARRWRWTGTAMIEVSLDAEGLVQTVNLSHSSGFRVLDAQAVEIVRRVPRLYVPAQLRGRPQRAIVPIGFQMTDL